MLPPVEQEPLSCIQKRSIDQMHGEQRRRVASSQAEVALLMSFADAQRMLSAVHITGLCAIGQSAATCKIDIPPLLFLAAPSELHRRIN